MGSALANAFFRHWTLNLLRLRPPRSAATMALATLILTGLVCASVSAGEPSPSDNSPLLITLGSYGVYAPRFEGSKRHDISPWPIISWRRQGEKEWLDLPTDGLDYALIETDKFRARLAASP